MFPFVASPLTTSVSRPRGLRLQSHLVERPVSCLLWGEGRAFDVVRQLALSDLVGTTATALGPMGPCGTGEFFTLGTEGTHLTIPTEKCTVAMVRRTTDTTARASATFGTDSATTNQRIGANLPFSDTHVFWDFGGTTTGTSRLDITGYTKTAGATESWVFVAGARGMAVYLNGRSIGSHTTAITRSASTSAFKLNAGLSLVGDNQDFGLFLMMHTEWTPTQVRQWATAPFSVFAPVPTRYLLKGSAAPPPGFGALLAEQRNRLVIA